MVPKGFRRGTHRVVAPSATVARLRPLLPALGITRIADVTGLDRIGLPVVVVCRPAARSTAVFHGKGLDREAATASGLMEAAEAYHAEHLDRPLRLASYEELQAQRRVIEIGALPRVSRARVERDLPMLWLEGKDLLDGGSTWLPHEVVHLNDALPPLPGRSQFAVGTNGLASGNHCLEAISHALCEVIERDATSLWHQGAAARRAATRIVLESVDDDACREVLARFRGARLTAAVWDITSDTGVPAFHCILVDTERNGHVGYGNGCHPVPVIALLRALTEAAQVRLTYIIGSREDLRWRDYARPALVARRRSAEALLAMRAVRPFRKDAGADFADFEKEVAWLLERLRAIGVSQVVAVDLEHPRFGLAVVRVVVPGLEGSDHHGDYVPGARVMRELRA